MAPPLPTDAADIAVEDPRVGDAAALVEELIAFIEDLYPEDDDDPPAPWSAEDLARDASFLLVRIGGEAAACGGLVRLAEPRALEVVRMYVRPQFRGRRLGDQVLSSLESLALARGAAILKLRCGPRQPDALKLYERNGYVRRGPFAQHREHPTNIFYEKRLGGS